MDFCPCGHRGLGASASDGNRSDGRSPGSTADRIMALQKSRGKRAVEGVAGGGRVNRANRVGGQENSSAIRQRKKTAALAEFEENVAAAAPQEDLRNFFHGIFGDVL